VDAYVVIAAESKRNDSLGRVQQLRTAGWRWTVATPHKRGGKEFQAVDAANTRFGSVIGAEFPTMILQNMRTRDKMEVNAETLPVKLKEWSEAPTYGLLLA
jgi:histidyl-tRNA synthetase